MKWSWVLDFRKLVVRLLALLALLSPLSVAQSPSGPSFNVLTWQNDYGRTGMNLQEQNLGRNLW